MSTTERRTSIALSKETRDKLNALKKELGFRSITALFNYAVLELTREGLIPPASFGMVFEKTGTKPVILTGKTGAGKTTTVRSLVSEWEGNTFILDVRGDEYPEFEAIDLGAVFSERLWKGKDRRVRFISNSNADAAKGEASAIFGHLNFLKNTGLLKNWLIVIEEGHRFSQDANLRALLIEGRKFARKIILVTTDWRVYEGITEVVKPRPWEPDPTAGPKI